MQVDQTAAVLGTVGHRRTSALIGALFLERRTVSPTLGILV
jgi:hypothetical protein